MFNWLFTTKNMKPTFLLVGLGNPGTKYKETRHNVGWWFIDELQKEYDGSEWKFDKKHQAFLSTVSVNGNNYTLVKPQTFMNLSGDSVQSLVAYYNMEQENLCIIYDDIDLEPGVTRFRKQGSGGTHNGMRDIVSKLNEHVARFRIGVGRPLNGEDLSNFVLSGFAPNDKQLVLKSITEAISLDWLETA
jgi:PTH1 family peptidyl-tRNA hydrolase